MTRWLKLVLNINRLNIADKIISLYSCCLSEQQDDKWEVFRSLRMLKKLLLVVTAQKISPFRSAEAFFCAIPAFGDEIEAVNLLS